MASIKLKGDVSGEVTISAPSVAGTTTLELPATSSTLATQNSLGVRNLIINGDMRIAQRSTSVASITTTGYYTLDRWLIGLGSLGTFTMSQSTDVPTGEGFAKSLKLDCTTADATPSASDELVLVQRFEGQNLQYLKKGTANAVSLTASFWVKSTKTGTFICELRDNNNSRNISKSYTVNVSNTWEKKTITFEGDTTGALNNDNGGSLQLNFWLGAGTDFTSGTLNTSWGANVNANRVVGQVNLADSTSNYINITGVQLEVGTEATPFEHRPYDMELQRCQRYYLQYDYTARYETIFMPTFIGSATGQDAILYFPVEMRSSPNISHNGVGNFRVNVAGGLADQQCSGISVSQINKQKARFNFEKPQANMTAGNAGFVNTQEDNDASIYISAEL